MTEIKKGDVITRETGMIKYNTNIDGVFIYEVQSGWNWLNTILSNEIDGIWLGEQSIIIEYSDYIDGTFTGQKTIHYNGLESQYILVD